MKYIGHRFLQSYATPRKQKKLLHRVLLVLVLCMLLWALLAECCLKLVTPELTEEAVRSYVLGEVYRAASEQLEETPVQFSLQNKDNKTLLQADSSAFSKLQAGVLAKLERTLNKTVIVTVPLGSFTGLRVLNGRGPGVPLHLKLESSVAVLFQTEFVSAGVNQTCHRVLMTVTVSSYSQSNTMSVQTCQSATTTLAETVLAGEVPGVLWDLPETD